MSPPSDHLRTEGSPPTECDTARKVTPNSMGREQFRSHPRRTQRTAEYDVLATYIQDRFRYDHTLGRFDYPDLRPIYAALSTTVHSSGLIPNHRSLFPAATPTYTLDYRNGDPLIRYRIEFA